MVLMPLASGIILIVLSVWVYNMSMSSRLSGLRLNIVIYIAASIMGTLFVHTALDNISKYLKTGLLDDRFNFENESFSQNEKLQENKYSVNIPMRYYYKREIPKGLGEHHQSFPRHLGGGNAGFRKDVLDNRAVHTPAL